MTPAPTAPGSSLRGPFRLAIALLVVTTVTILWGAMTTSTGSGLAFLDWPTSDGEFMPERSYTTVPGFLEHFHRLLGACAGLIVLTLTIWLARHPSASRAARRTAWFGLGLIIVQGVIGGVGVLKGLLALTSVTHGALAQVTLATFAWLAYLLSARRAATVPLANVPPGRGRTLSIIGIAVLIAQTLLGGVARHTNSTHALWSHVSNAAIVFLTVTVVTAFAVGKLADAPGIKGLARWLITLLIVQIVLGFVALAIRNSAGKTPENVANLGTAAVISVHVLLGALLTMLMATLAAHVHGATRPRSAAPQGSPA